MSRFATLGLSVLAIFALAMAFGPGVLADTGVEIIGIQVSPQTILIGADQAAYVTVHADIPYYLVDRAASLTLNGVEAAFTFSDDCGDLVGKFRAGEIEEVVSPGNVTMTLCGMTIDGDPFCGSCEVRVVVFSGKDKGADK